MLHRSQFGKLLNAYTVATFACVTTVPAAKIAPVVPHPLVRPATLDELNVPERFQQLIADRTIIDRYQKRHRSVAGTALPTPFKPRLNRHPVPNSVELLQPDSQSDNQKLGIAMSEVRMIPERGFRAPILDEANDWQPLIQARAELKPKDLEAAQLINRKLATNGLLSTLCDVVQILGPAELLNDIQPSLYRLESIGFPADLLACFAVRDFGTIPEAAADVLQTVAKKVVANDDLDAVKRELESFPFRFPKVWSQFTAASESGERPLGMLRLQVGGGYFNGLIPGESIDVVGQLVAAFPRIDYVVSIPAAIERPLNFWAANTLPLTRHHQFKMIAEPYEIETWAQDNGKAGTSQPDPTEPPVWTSLAPRYASRDEGASAFLPTESFLMDNLNTTALRVLHSPLLFQGGNVMPIIDPSSGRRLLLVGEGVVHRNETLGLNRKQVLEAMRQSFGADSCLPLPAVSFHLDFDVSFRSTNDELIGFVNDPQSAVAKILELGIETLQKHGLLDASQGIAFLDQMRSSDRGKAVESLLDQMHARADANGQFDETIASWFHRTSVDSGPGNLQVFMQALDLLEATSTDAFRTGQKPERRNYLEALANMERLRTNQLAALEAHGWKLVKIPSMPNLYRSINYLNGIQHKGGYIMPTYGGFYAALDDAAEKAFSNAMEPGAEICRIQCAELQRKNGAVHCAAAAFPSLNPISEYTFAPGRTPSRARDGETFVK